MRDEIKILILSASDYSKVYSSYRDKDSFLVVAICHKTLVSNEEQEAAAAAGGVSIKGHILHLSLVLISAASYIHWACVRS